MLDKLEKLEKDFLEIQDKLSQPEVISDMAKYRDLSRKYKELKSTADLAAKYREAIKLQKEAEEILANEKDAEVRELAEIQLEESSELIKKYDEQAKLELLPKDPNDIKDCIVEIRAGTGGDEAAIFAGEIARMYLRYVETQGWQSEMLSKSEGAPGCIKEIIFAVKGEGSYGKLKYESGVHRVQRIPVTESQGRVHTSAASVAVLPEAEEVDVQIKDSDLKIDVFRSSGPGGQSVNTTDSAVRVTHVPTGIVISCQDEKSQLKNKAKALKILRTRLFDMEMEKQMKERGDARASQIGSGDRSEKIRTYNFPQDRVTDHRVHQNWSNLPAIMGGEIEDIIQHLQKEDQDKKLSNIGK